MNVIVTDTGFGDDPFAGKAPDLDIMSDIDPGTLAGQLAGLAMIRLTFTGFADGRGFSIARRLRQLGFTGQLRAKGILADQYTMARRAGFDEVEIDEAMAMRQPQDQWLARADWQAHDYQNRLKGTLDHAA
ncbi:MAG: DUF934 domain-containing protein [Rhodobacteraceae bacterium]|nr:DUF934 domain-containing protein [Paracoccaceae bacterium]